jgi:hypothetical protein
MATNTPQSGFSNSILICVDCGEEFVFTASAQQYFAERGFTEPPKRCKSCYNEYRTRDVAEPEEEVTESPERPLLPPDSGSDQPPASDRP